jgi:transposase-like protein
MAPFKQVAVYRYDQTFGRPSEYRPEYCALIIQKAAEHGLSISAFAGVVGVATQTIYQWMKAHDDFADACARAKAARLLWWELKLGRSRKGAETTASIFALKNAAPDEWRDIKHTDHTLRISPKQLTDEQLEAIAAGHSPADLGIIDGSSTRLNEK